MMNFAQAAIAAQKGGQNIAGATLGNMMGGQLAQMPGFGGSANGSQAATTSGGGLGIEQQVIDASSSNQAQGGGGNISELSDRVSALEDGGQNQLKTPNVSNINTLESGAPNNSIPANQQKTVGNLMQIDKPNNPGASMIASGSALTRKIQARGTTQTQEEYDEQAGFSDLK